MIVKEKHTHDLGALQTAAHVSGVEAIRDSSVHPAESPRVPLVPPQNEGEETKVVVVVVVVEDVVGLVVLEVVVELMVVEVVVEVVVEPELLSKKQAMSQNGVICEGSGVKPWSANVSLEQ